MQKVQRNKVIKQIKKSLKNGGDAMPTIAEMWIKEGKEQGKLEDAQKMVELGMSNSDVGKITGLKPSKIRELRKKL